METTTLTMLCFLEKTEGGRQKTEESDENNNKLKLMILPITHRYGKSISRNALDTEKQ